MPMQNATRSSVRYAKHDRHERMNVNSSVYQSLSRPRRDQTIEAKIEKKKKKKNSRE